MPGKISHSEEKIGGFFPLHLPLKENRQSILSLWDIPKLPHRFFRNGRSALHHLLKFRGNKTLWLPAYSCMSLTEAAKNTGVKIKFFPLKEDSLSPDITYLKTHIKSGDAVLAIDYFGRNPDSEFLKFTAQYADIDWIEDRAQGLLPSAKPWGDYILYSPRKLLGVPDGSILVARKKPLPTSPAGWNDRVDFIKPSLLRYEDAQEIHNQVWHKANQAYENKMKVSALPISRISRYILSITEAPPIISRRKANYSLLMNKLESIALLPATDKSFVPFGFPVLVENHGKLIASLHRKNIFAARHWPELPSPLKEFHYEHDLSSKLITLPCDQRYGPEHMEKIAALVEQVSLK